MCGIAGIVDFRGRPVEPQTLTRLCEKLAHRGPDDRGCWQRHGPGFAVGLAHTRLAVIDPSPEGHQPMTEPGGRWAIAYNGELYNFQELRRELGDPWHSACDTEVVLRAYMTWGPAAFERFDAMYALAVVDSAQGRGCLARDPFGIKPLYYACFDDRLVFASELRALRVVPGLPTEIDREALHLYLHLGFIPHPWTIYRHVRKLPPGHRLDFDRSGVGEPVRFHRLPVPPEPPPPYDEACRHVRQLVENAVDRQCIADVPLGAFLSGGLDSAVVVAAMARKDRKPIRTFSIGYPEHPRYDETRYARMVADHCGTEHHECRLSFADVLSAVEPMLNHMGEPFADSSLLPTALVSRYTREHVTVALSGDGGDELFGGYWRYLGHHYLERYRRLPGLLRKGLIEPLLGLLPSARSTRRLDRLRQIRKLLRGDLPDPLDRHLAWARFLDSQLATELIGAGEATSVAATLKRLYAAAPSGLRPGSSACGNGTSLVPILLADLAVTLPADMLNKVDLASMYHSLEVRVPLLSSDVVDYVTALPVGYRVAGTATKRILCDAFRECLPAEILNRGKMGFEVPVGEFLRHELRDLYREVVTPAVLGDLGIHARAAETAFNDHLVRRHDHTELLWSLLVACWWYRSDGN